MTWRSWASALAVAGCLGTQGCVEGPRTYYHEVEPGRRVRGELVVEPLQDIVASPIEPLPVRVGVLYTSVRASKIEHVVPQYTSGDAVVWYDRYVLHLGEASITMLDRVLPALFADTVRVGSRPPLSCLELELDPGRETVFDPLPLFGPLLGLAYTLSSWPLMEQADCDALAVDAVLEPQIVTADAVAVVYRFVLYAPDGATIMAWTVRGEGRQGSKAPTADNLGLAMRDAAARLLIEFPEQPEVVAWMTEIARAPATGDGQ